MRRPSGIKPENYYTRCVYIQYTYCADGHNIVNYLRPVGRILYNLPQDRNTRLYNISSCLNPYTALWDSTLGHRTEKTNAQQIY